MKQLKNFIFIVSSLLTTHFLMYYIIDEVIVKFADSPAPYIVGRFLLAIVIFISLKLLFKEFEMESVYVNWAMAIYLIFLFSITLYRGELQSRDFNFRPFNFLNDFSEVNVSTFIVSVLINSLMLVPLGAYLSMKNLKIAFSGQTILLCSLVIEGLQFLTKRGSFDVDDLMLNTLGGCLGYFVVNLIHNKTTKNKRLNSSGIGIK